MNRSQSVDQQSSKLNASANPNSRKLFDYKLAAAATGNNTATPKSNHPGLQLGEQFKSNQANKQQQQENLAKSKQDSSANSSTLAREQLS